jgi:aprataxin
MFLQVPSMRQLHLHVISQDFHSANLKNKKHWNSFTTAFFLDSVDVMEEVEQHGSVSISPDEKILAMELRCHRCKSAHPNIPKLKSHIAACKSSFPSHLLKKDKLLSATTPRMDCA